jgi:hypothetical protein
MKLTWFGTSSGPDDNRDCIEKCSRTSVDVLDTLSSATALKTYSN